MALPVTIPNTFANATSSIPLSQLDTNFTTLSNAINGINSGAETLANLVATTANVTTGNITTVNATTVDTTNIEVTNIKAKDGTASVAIADSTGAVTVSTLLNVDNLRLDGNTISSTDTNGNIVLAPNGSGDVQVDADTLRVGDSGSDATIQSNGNADLILKTGNATTGSVTLADGADGSLTIALNGTGQVIVNAGAVGTPTIAPTGDTNTGIFFPAADTIAFAEGGAEAMRIDSSGNVGIGTSSPSTLLNVQKADVSGFSPNTTFDVMVLENGTSGTGTVLQIVAATNGTSEVAFSDTTRNVGLIAYNHTDDVMTFRTASAERARITSGGDLLVGMNSSDYLAADDGIQIKPAGFIRIGGSGTSSRTVMSFVNNTAATPAEVGTITTNASATAYNTSSDYRLKENVAPMTGALAKVLELNPVTYNWKANGSAGQGFIAHELQAVVPECVVGEKDAVQTYTDEEGNEQTRPVYQGVDTSFLVATLTAAIQELKAINDAQASRIETLEAKVAALEANDV